MVPQDEHVKELCLEAKQRGWEKAVAERYDSLERAPWIADLSRADPLLFSQISSASTVLDLGCRYGVSSFALSPLCRTIISLDSDNKYADFVSIRSHQDKIKNVISICADINQLPFKESSFDLIIMNRQIIRNITKANLDDLLETTHALLKSKGQVFIGVDRSSSRFSNCFLPYRKLHKRLCRIGFKIDKVVLPLKSYPNFKFLIDGKSKADFHFVVDLIISEYTAKPLAEKLYRALAATARGAGLANLMSTSTLFHSYLIFARKN